MNATIASLFDLFKNPSTQPRGWWDAPAAGRCRGMQRVRTNIYGPTIQRGQQSRWFATLKSGALYLIGENDNFIRINRPHNKHERRVYEKKVAADFKAFAKEYGLPPAITAST